MNIKKGSVILIAHKHHTESTVGVSPSMEKMVGKKCRVDGIRDDYNVYINDKYGNQWIWNIKDLKPITRRKRIKPELFNPENLIGKE